MRQSCVGIAIRNESQFLVTKLFTSLMHGEIIRKRMEYDVGGLAVFKWWSMGGGIDHPQRPPKEGALLLTVPPLPPILTYGDIC